jgi:hypothetical protein
MNIERSVQDGVRLGKMIGGFLAILARPVSLTTQALFKKNMGERYFATWHAVVALGLILLASWASFQDTKSSQTRVTNSYGERSIYTQSGRFTPMRVYVVGGVWLTAFTFVTLVHRARIRSRYERGERWHSRCSGEPIHEQLRPWARYLATAGIGLGLYKLRLEPIAGLVWVSLIVTMMDDEWERWLFYSAVLDAVDGQIEAEHLAVAVEKRSKPSEVAGVVAPLPSYISDSYRLKVAEAIRSGSGSRKGASVVAGSEVEAKPSATAPTASPGT